MLIKGTINVANRDVWYVDVKGSGVLDVGQALWRLVN